MMSKHINEKEKKRYIRGLIEEGFDIFLQEKTLKSIISLAKVMEPYIKRKEDVVIGLISGAIWERYSTSYRLQLGRVPNPNENIEIFIQITEKVPKITERLKQLSMK